MAHSVASTYTGHSVPGLRPAAAARRDLPQRGVQGRYSRRAISAPRSQVSRLRHHAITELAESQANDSIIREIDGHVSPRMLAHYSHVRMETKRKALDALSGGGSGGSYGTNRDTNSPAQPNTQPQVIEKIGGA